MDQSIIGQTPTGGAFYQNSTDSGVLAKQVHIDAQEDLKAGGVILADDLTNSKKELGDHRDEKDLALMNARPRQAELIKAPEPNSGSDSSSKNSQEDINRKVQPMKAELDGEDKLRDDLVKILAKLNKDDISTVYRLRKNAFPKSVKYLSYLFFPLAIWDLGVSLYKSESIKKLTEASSKYKKYFDLARAKLVSEFSTDTIEEALSEKSKDFMEASKIQASMKSIVFKCIQKLAFGADVDKELEAPMKGHKVRVIYNLEMDLLADTAKAHDQLNKVLNVCAESYIKQQVYSHHSKAKYIGRLNAVVDYHRLSQSKLLNPFIGMKGIFNPFSDNKLISRLTKLKDNTSKSMAEVSTKVSKELDSGVRKLSTDLAMVLKP